MNVPFNDLSVESLDQLYQHFQIKDEAQLKMTGEEISELYERFK